jgi:hypothetical protein
VSVTPHFNAVAALAILLPLAMGAFALQTRRQAFMQREHELREAAELLRIYTNEMRKLDDYRMPHSLLRLICTLGRILHEPEILPVSTRVLSEKATDAHLITPEIQATIEALNGDYATLQERQPDLAAAYSKALFAGILSFEKRYPECAGGFSVSLPQVVSSPVQTAQRIVRQAGSRAGWDVEPSDAIPV